MNMLKRSLAMLLVLTLLFSFVPFSVFADDGESVETTAVTGAVEQRSGGPGNSDFGHSRGNGKDKHKHKDPLKETEAPEVTEAPTETTVPETTVPETTVPETTVPETTVPETTVPETTVPETTVPETTVPETTVPETTVPETTVPETTVPETTVPETEPLIRCMLSDAELNAASTDGVYTGTVDAPSAFLKVFHLDVGRKYFTVDQVKDIIDTLAAKYYTHMELAIGNDGLRFLLDDMSVGAYDSATVTAGVKAGNAAYSHAGEWSEDDMDAIIAYANSKGIEIIPLLNTPGHMDAILDAMEACKIYGSYNGSARTVDVTNATAVAFTQALVSKYVDYFAGYGCTYFNIGADEYANDIYTSDSTGMGFGHLVSQSKYGYFVEYINELVDIVADAGMTPIAFNDGIYYNETTSFGTFDTRLMIAYWSCGWGGIKPASASFLAGKGHHILNTNDGWYYVLGRASSTYGYSGALSNATKTSVTTVTGDDYHVVTPIGAMQCVWCDTPSVSYTDSEVTRIKTLIQTLAANNTDYFKAPEETEPAPSEPTPSEPVTPVEPDPVVDEETNVGVTAEEVKDIEVAEVAKDSLPVDVVEAAAEGKIVAFNVTPKKEDGTDYTGEATVSIPVLAEWTNVRGGVLASNHGGEVIGIEGDLKTDAQGNKTFTFTVPHFSTVVAYELETAAETPEGTVVEVKLEVGETKTITDNSGNYGSGTVLNDAYAQAITEGTTESGGKVFAAVDSVSGGSAYYVTNTDGDQYLTASADWTDNISEAAQWTITANGNGYRLQSGRNYLRYNYGWTTTTSSYNAATVYFNEGTLYRTRNSSWGNVTYSNAFGKPGTAKDKPPVNKTDITFTGITPGETTVTVGSTTYKIVVSKKTESATISIGDTLTYDDSSATTPVVDNSGIVNASITDGKLTITAVAEGTAKVTTDNGEYTITVIPFNPDNVAKVPVYFWITSHPIHDAQDRTEMEIGAGDPNVYSAEGAKLTDLIPFTGTDPQNESNADTVYNLWQVRLQHKDNVQTNVGSDDKTAVGEHVEYIRYYNSKWQVKDLSGTWLDIDLTNEDQLTAYYLMRSPLTEEVDSLVKDWGFQFKEGQKYWQYFAENSYAALSAQVIYEGGTMNPANDTSLINTTVFFNYWAKGQDGHDSNRNLGYFLPQFNDEYEVYKITTMHGSCSVTASSDNATKASVNYGNPDPNHEDEVIVWEIGDGIPEVVGDSSRPELTWQNSKDAILIRIYLRAKKTDDSLTVIYVDEKFNDQLYTYQISVDAGINFTDNIDPTPGPHEGNAERIDVTGCHIVNKKGVNEAFQTDLTKVPEAKGKYDSELYTYTGSEISEDGKTLYLYYNINTTVLKPNFVVDFGLPITFNLSDVTEKPDLAKTVTASARYGTVDYNAATKVFTYKPTKILQNIDVISVNILFDGENTTSTTNVGVTPATTVYYEESFLTYDSNWRVGAAPTKTQKTEVLGNSTYYGYDDAYNGVNNPADRAGSNGTQAVSQTNGATASFTFTGTGFELYANSKPASGIVTVYSEGNVSKLYMIDTALTPGDSAATNQQNGDTYYSLPIISENSLPHGTYTVQLRQTDEKEAIYIDGVRVINTLHPDTTIVVKKDGQDVTQNIYLADEEDHPAFYELRDYVLKALSVDNGTSKDYGAMKDKATQVYNDLIATTGEAPTAVVTAVSDIYGDSATLQDLLDNGPKNELYLYKGQSLTFRFQSDRVAQLGLKSPVGNAKFTISDTDLSLSSLSTTVDMFYKIADKGSASDGMTVTIAVTEGVLSVTDLKICDDPNAALLPLTLADIENTLVNVYGFSNEETPVEPPVPETPTEPSKPVEPTEPEKPTEPEVEETKPTKPGKPEKPAKPGQNKPGKPAEKQKDAKLKITYVNLLGKKVGSATLTETGAANQRCTFSVSEIFANAPAGRNALWFLPVVVPYGGNVSIVVPVI